MEKSGAKEGTGMSILHLYGSVKRFWGARIAKIDFLKCEILQFLQSKLPFWAPRLQFAIFGLGLVNPSNPSRVSSTQELLGLLGMLGAIFSENSGGGF